MDRKSGSFGSGGKAASAQAGYGVRKFADADMPAIGANFRAKKIYKHSPPCRRFRGIIFGKEVAVGNAQSKVNMLRLTYTLRLCAVVVSFPVIVLVIACATLLHPITSFKTKFHTSLRLWMSVMDWIEGIPIGYTYWVQYHAPAMLDEIAVHHDE